MNGEHQLDKQEPVMVVGADNLTLEGQGEWIAGPEEAVMLSTAVINCTNGKGGFSFINSSSITIQGLTFLTCGTKSYPQDIVSYSGTYLHTFIPYAAVFVMKVKLFQFYQNSIQDNTQGLGLLVYQCDEVKVTNCSFFNTNNQSQYAYISLLANATVHDCGAIGFIWSSFINAVVLEMSYSNFTNCSGRCGLFPLGFGPIYVFSHQNKQMLNADFSNLMCFNNIGDLTTASCIYADLRSATVLQIVNSIFKQNVEAAAIVISADPF